MGHFQYNMRSLLKKIITLLLAALLSSATVSAASALKCKSSVDAENYLKFNLPDKASDCFDRLIIQNPTDAKLHFLKGKFCLNQGNLRCAKDRFSAGVVKTKYGKRIAILYAQRAYAKLNAGDLQKAEELYREAFLYDPILSKKVAASLLRRGKQASNTKASSDLLLYMAGKIDLELNPAISGYYYSLSQAASTSEERVDMLEKAVRFNNAKYSREYEENKQTLGRYHLEEAKKLGRKVGHENATNENRALAIKYLGEAAVESDMPGEIIYQPGEYSFQLQANEQTPHWISFPEGEYVNYTVSSSEPNCTIIYDDGEVVSVGSKITLGHSSNKVRDKFKIEALTDQTEITMLVEASQKKNGANWWENNVAPLWQHSIGRFCFLSDSCK